MHDATQSEYPSGQIGDEFGPQTHDLITTARSLTVKTGEAYGQAGELLKLTKTLANEISSFFKPLKDKAFAAHRALCDAEREKLRPLSEAEDVLKRSMIAFDQEQERIRAEEQRRLEEEARRQREAEQLRLAEEARKAAEDAALEEAARLEAEGKHELAAQLLENPPEPEPIEMLPPPAPVFVPRSTPKVSGIATRKVWKWRVVNAAQIQARFLMADEKKISAVVRALGREAAAQVGGIEVWEDSVMAASGRR